MSGSSSADFGRRIRRGVITPEGWYCYYCQEVNPPGASCEAELADLLAEEPDLVGLEEDDLDALDFVTNPDVSQ